MNRLENNGKYNANWKVKNSKDYGTSIQAS